METRRESQKELVEEEEEMVEEEEEVEGSTDVTSIKILMTNNRIQRSKEMRKVSTLKSFGLMLPYLTLS